MKDIMKIIKWRINRTISESIKEIKRSGILRCAKDILSEAKETFASYDTKFWGDLALNMDELLRNIKSRLAR